MGVFAGGSESNSKTFDLDQSIDASEQAVVWTPRNSDKNKGNIRLAGKSTLQVYNSYGPNAEQLGAALTGLGASIQNSIASALGAANDRDVADAVEDRIRNQIAAGGETAVREASGSLGFSNYVLLAAGAFVLVLAIWMKRKK